MKSWKKSVGIWISALGATWACRMDTWQAPETAFVVIDSASLAGNVDSVGSLRVQIEGIWLFSATEPLGAYPMGARIPINPEQVDTLILKAGVRESGLANTLIPYPFFQPLFLPFTASIGRIDTLRPAFRYYPHTRFWFIEGFENAWSYWGASSRNTASFSVITAPDQTFEGRGTLHAQVAQQHIFEIITLESYAVDTLRSSVYFEMHYRTDDTLVVGAYIIQGRDTLQRPLIYLKPTSKWRKIYINFTDFLGGATEGMRARFFVGARNLDSTIGHTWLDNLKVLSF